MTEKIERRGIRTPGEYVADTLAHTLVRQVASRTVVALQATDTLTQTRAWLESGAKGTTHQGFPILDARQTLVGVLTRRDLLDPSKDAALTLSQLIQRLPKFVYDDCTVRQAADHMVNHGIGRLPVLCRDVPPRVVGMITRSDILSVFQRGIHDRAPQKPTIALKWPPLTNSKRPQKTS